MKLIPIIIIIACIGAVHAHNELSESGGPRFPGNLIVGASGDSITIDPTTGITFQENAKMRLSMRPFIEIGDIAVQEKPTVVAYGATKGYSLPLYASNEEIFFSEYIAGRWDGASNITVSVIGYLDTAETADDDFNLTLQWQNKATGAGSLTSTVNTVYQVTNCPSGRNAQYSIYKIDFPIDWDLPSTDVAASDFFAGRLYRSAVGAGNVEVAGEFVVTMIVITYQVDKVFKVS
jgi:hypothetical protein